MRARFTSIAGSSIDPTGSITVQGDFYHLSGGMLAIDLGGHSAGVDYDAVNVIGKVELEGDLAVSLADVNENPFAPGFGDTFSILTATQGVTGQFANVALPQLPWNLDWRVDYLANTVNLVVYTSGDFNDDGIVNVADYVVWRKNVGTQSEYDTWRSHFGQTIGLDSGATIDRANGASVPEPMSAVLWLLASAVGFCRRYRGGPKAARAC